MAIFNFPTGYTAYVSPFGRDDNPGTKDAPYRTLQKAKDANKTNICLSDGVYRANPTFGINGQSVSIIGFKNAIIDNFLAGNSFSYWTNGVNLYFTRLFFTNTIFNVYTVDQTCQFQNCMVKGGSLNYLTGGGTNTVIQKVSGNIGISTGNGFAGNKFTFYKCVLNITTSLLFNSVSHIFHTCDISIIGDVPLRYNVFYNCNFKIGNEASYTALTGADDAAKLANLKARYTAKYPTATYNFEGCRVADPMFNNPEMDDFTLQPLSPARHAAYDGTFVGAKDVGYPTYAYVNDLGHSNAFYNASKTANVLVADNAISLVRNVDGSAVGGGNITEKSKDYGVITELKSNQLSYLWADRNREMPNYSPAIDMAAPIAAGTPLVNGKIYINEVGAVTYNGTDYPVRSRIYTIDTNSFTTIAGGVLYLVTENISPLTNLFRFKNSISSTEIAAGTNLTVNSWYRVKTNSITWNALVIPVGDVFQAIAGQLSFTGTGVCVEEFNDVDVWNEIVINAPITCRRVGNIALGAIDTGTDGKLLLNGHSEYNSTANVVRAEFTVFARYTQIKHYLSASEAK